MAFKMNGHTLPGIKQSKEGKMADGRAKSSALQFSLPDPLNLFGGNQNNCPTAQTRAVPGAPPPKPPGPAPTTSAPVVAPPPPVAVAEEAPAITMKKNLKVGVPKLVGKQKNIDKNKNGKIDAGDFKAMKNGPTKKSKY